MLNPLLYYWLRLDEFLILFDAIDRILAAYDLEDLQLTKIHEQVNDARDRMRSRRRLRWSSKHTKDVVLLHKQRGEAWLCLYYHLLARTYSQDVDVRKRAKDLLGELNASKIKTYEMGYSDLSARLAGVIQKVDSSNSLQEELKAFNAWSFYESMKEMDSRFMDKTQARNDEQTKRPKIKGSEVAKEFVELYKKLTQTLSVLGQLTGKEEYEKIAREINLKIKELNTDVKARKTRSKNRREQNQDH